MEKEDFKVFFKGEEYLENEVEEKTMGIIDVEIFLKEILGLERLSLERVLNGIDFDQIILDERNHHVNTDDNKENFNDFKIKVYESISKELDFIYNSYLLEIKKDLFISEFYESLILVSNSNKENINKITDFNSIRSLSMQKAGRILNLKNFIESEISLRKPRYTNVK